MTLMSCFSMRKCLEPSRVAPYSSLMSARMETWRAVKTSCEDEPFVSHDHELWWPALSPNCHTELDNSDGYKYGISYCYLRNQLSTFEPNDESSRHPFALDTCFNVHRHHRLPIIDSEHNFIEWRLFRLLTPRLWNSGSVPTIVFCSPAVVGTWDA